MNWLGAGLRGFAGALAGILFGLVIFVFASARGIDVPPVVGLLGGLGAMLASAEASGPRGIVIGSLAVCVCATTEVWLAPVRGLASDLLHFSERLGLFRLFLYALCAVFGIIIGGRSRWSLKFAG